MTSSLLCWVSRIAENNLYLNRCYFFIFYPILFKLGRNIQHKYCLKQRSWIQNNKHVPCSDDVTSNFANLWHGLPCWIFRSHGLITWLQVLNHELLFSVPCCFLLDGLIKETICSVMVDHLQSRVAPWRQYASHLKVRGTLLKMDVST